MRSRDRTRARFPRPLRRTIGDVGPAAMVRPVAIVALAGLFALTGVAGPAFSDSDSGWAREGSVPKAAAADLHLQEDPYLEARHEMVRRQIAAPSEPRRAITDSAVLEAMRTVPRHEFVSPGQRTEAYSDRALPIGHGQTISQPYIVAFMTELLEPGPDDVVFELGTGSGYHAAVLAEIVRHVYTVEIVEPLARTAVDRLERLGYGNVSVRHGDGYYGWTEAAPFDAIVVTAAASHIPPPLTEQLAPDGRMVIPVGAPGQVQTLMLVEKDEDGTVRQRSVMPVRFVPLRRAPDG